jgi:hypothetical protein
MNPMATTSSAGAISNSESSVNLKEQQHIQDRCRLVDHFLESANRGYPYGIYGNDPSVMSFAASISRNQRKKYRHYGIVPAALFRYLHRKGVILETPRVPEKYRTVGHLSDLMWQTCRDYRGNWREAGALRNSVILDRMPWLRKQFGSASHMYRIRQ